jgi:hypothetical protein
MISADGLTRLARTDTYGCYIFNSTTDRWDQLFTAARLTGTTAKFVGYGPIGCYALACSLTSSSRIYALAYDPRNPAISCRCVLWRSEDRGTSWIDTGQTCSGNTGCDKNGPLLAIDPTNPDVVYWGNSAGLIFRSLDGGSTIYDNGPITGLLSALCSGTTSAQTTNNVLNFSSTPAALQGAVSLWCSNMVICAHDITHPAALGDGSAYTQMAFPPQVTSTTARLQNNVGNSPGVSAGDTIYFGCGPSIVFNPTAGTTKLGGVTVSKEIYVGWSWGANNIYVSTNGGSSFAAVSGTGATSVQNMAFSSDGVLYVCDLTPTGAGHCNTHTAWRYVTPSNTASLTAGWTHFTYLANAPGNTFHCPAADPLNPGRVAFCTDSGTIAASADYGATWKGNTGASIRIATDAPWLEKTVEAAMSAGHIVFDPLVSNRLWFSEGIAMWYGDCISTDTAQLFYSKTLNIEQIIFNQIIKVPNGGPIFMALGDRCMFIVPDPETAPKNNHPQRCYFSGFIDDGTGNGTYNAKPGHVLSVTSITRGTMTLGGFHCFVTGDNVKCNTFLDGYIGQLNGHGSKGGIGRYHISGYPSYTGQDKQAVPPTGMQLAFFEVMENFSIDYSKADPKFLVSVVGNYVGELYSSEDSGETWGLVSNPQFNVGQILCQTKVNMVWFPWNGVTINQTPEPRYTKDGGATWHVCTFNGIAKAPTAGWGGNFAYRHTACCDLVDSSTFYVYNPSTNGLLATPTVANAGNGYAAGDTIYLAGADGDAQGTARLTVASITGNGGTGPIATVTVADLGSYKNNGHPPSPSSQKSTTGHGNGATFITTWGPIGGLWRSTDGGVTWDQRSPVYYNVFGDVGVGAQLLAFPGHQGHLLYAPGNGAFSPELKWSGDGGKTLTNVANVNVAQLAAIGKEKPGNNYPAVYIYGTANGDTIPAVYRSDNFTSDARHNHNSVSWRRLCDGIGAGSLDLPHTMCGDSDIYGTIYIGTSASGYTWGHL